MEYVPLDPLVNDALQAITKRIGHIITCPMCGSEEWSALHNRFLRLDTPLDMTEAEIDAATDAEMYANVRSLALICEGCEFLATFVIREDDESDKAEGE